MEVNVTMKEPGSRVVGGETNSDVIATSTSVDCVTKNWVDIVGSSLTNTSDDVESVLKREVEFEFESQDCVFERKRTPCKWKG